MNKKIKNILTIIVLLVVTIFTGNIVYANTMSHYRCHEDDIYCNRKENTRDSFHRNGYRQIERGNRCQKSSAKR